MSLTQSLAHAQRMSTATHRPDCKAVRHGTYDPPGGAPIHPDPACGGCVTDHDREQWAAQADELQQHLNRTTNQED